MFQVHSTDQALPSSLNPDVPRVFDDIVQKCLQKDPDLRYQSISDLLREIALVSFPSIVEPE